MIRLVRSEDAPHIQRIYEYYVRHTAITFETVPPAPDEIRRRIETISPEYPWLVHEEAACVDAYAYASRFKERSAYRWSVDFTVYTAHDRQGVGIGTKLYRALKAITAELGYHNAFAHITSPNEGSFRLHASSGFARVGLFPNAGYKLGRWHDVSVWHCLLRAYDREPAAPISLAEWSAHNDTALSGEG